MKNLGVFSLKVKSLALLLIPIIPLLLCLFYTLSAAYLGPCPGIEFEANWIITKI